MAGQDPNDDKPATRAGYDCEFVEPPQKKLQSECPVCLQILREPHLSDCCGYNFCAACIEHIEAECKPCPQCRRPESFTHVANESLKQALLEFRVYCPHRLRGCEWAGELGKLDEHLNSDPQPPRQLEGCQFAVIECLYCKEGIRRDYIAGHQLERCPQRPYTCEYCEKCKSTYDDVVHSHLLAVVPCDLHYAGCEVMLPRKDMADHMREGSIAHISLLAAENHRLSKRLMEKEDQMILLTQQNSERIIQLERDVTFQAQELTQTKQELMQTKHRVFAMETRLLGVQRQPIGHLQTQQQRDKQELRNDVAHTAPVSPVTMKMSEFPVPTDRYRLQAWLQRDWLRNRDHQHIVPVIMTMAGFEELKKEDTKWHSPPFHTSLSGYKMCLGVYAKGKGAGKGTHISVYTYVMRGRFDSCLKWPFRGTINVLLMNQLEDKEHYMYTIRYIDTTPDRLAVKVTDKEIADVGWGTNKFVLHSKLDQCVSINRQFLKDNCLFFRIEMPYLTY